MEQPSRSVSRVKRRRKIWACIECRKRKVQCDRQQPACGKCELTGQAASCQYVDVDDNNLSKKRAIAASSGPMLDHYQRVASMHEDHRMATTAPSLDGYQRRLDPPEPKTTTPSLARNKVSFPPVKSTSGLLHQSDDPLHGDYNLTVLHGSTFRTKFHGGTFSGTLAKCVPGLSEFTSDAFAAFPILGDIRHAASRDQQSMTTRSDSRPRTSREDLIALLVPREEIKKDTDRFLNDLGHIYHVIHGPTFERDCAQMWLNMSAADTRQIALTITMVAIVRLIDVRKNSKMREWQQAMSMLDACHDWQQGHDIKYDSVLDFQIAFLTLLGRQLGGKWYKRTWAKAGELIRTWMCAGMHRCMDVLHTQPTALTRELRARLWVAAAEFELQAAFEHGMSAHNWPEQSDVAAPLNIPDAVLEYDMRPKDCLEYTAVTYLAASSKSLRLRHRINNILNGTYEPLNLEQVNAYVDDIHSAVDAFNFSGSPQTTVTKSLLAINLLQYVLALVVRQLQSSPTTMEQQAYRCTLISTASRMLEHHKAAIECQSQVIEALYHDHVRIALSVCYCYLSFTPRSDCILTASIDTHAVEIMQTAASLLANKAKHYHGSRHNYWLVAAALGLIRTQKDPSRKALYLEEAVNLFSEPYTDMLLELQLDSQLQEGNDTSERNRAGVVALDTPLQLDFSIDEWFGQWSGDPTLWSTDF